MRKLFVCVVLCSVLLGSVCLLRLRLTPFRPPLRPQFLPDATRFRTDRVCGPLATLILNSAPWHQERRQVIRETWGHPGVLRPLGLSVAFGVGSSEDESTQRGLHWEAETFGDVIQLPLVDEYRSLPRKVLGLLRKVVEACVDPRPPLVLKVDDDVFVNVYALQSLLLGLASESSDQKTLWCLVWEGVPVVRTSNNSGWSHSLHDGDDHHPTYCSGAAYVMSATALRALLRANSTVPLQTISEDVHVTGWLALEAGVDHVQWGTRFAFESVRADRVAEGRTVFAHLGTDEPEGMTEELWTHLQRKRVATAEGL